MHPDLLAAVIANPDDDVPRLVLADWLDEHGEPERAEFIRLQLDIEKRRSEMDQPRPSVSVLSLLSRERILLHQHGVNWLAPLRIKGEPLYNRSSHAQFVRGFVEIVWMTAATFFKRGEQLMTKVPLRELRITRTFSGEIDELIAMPILSKLTTLDLSGRRVGRQNAISISRSPLFSSIKRLRLRNCDISDEGAKAIAECPFDWPLQELDLTGNLTSDHVMQLLCRRFGPGVVKGDWDPR